MANTAAVKIPKIAPVTFFREVLNELKKVTWPTRAETIKLTAVVIAVSVLVAVFVGGLDIFFVNLQTVVFR